MKVMTPSTSLYSTLMHPRPHQIEGNAVDVYSYPACDAELETVSLCRDVDLINESSIPLAVAS